MDDLAKRFTYHAPKPGQPAIYEELRGGALELAAKVDELVPDGREKSLAITNLEQVVFWANAGIARSGAE